MNEGSVLKCVQWLELSQLLLRSTLSDYRYLQLCSWNIDSVHRDNLSLVWEVLKLDFGLYDVVSKKVDGLFKKNYK